MTIRRRHIVGSATAAALGFPMLNAFGQGEVAWPKKPVRLIVPNVAGGASDLVARLMQVELQKIWSQPVLLEYKPGAGTVTGTGRCGQVSAGWIHVGRGRDVSCHQSEFAKEHAVRHAEGSGACLSYREFESTAVCIAKIRAEFSEGSHRGREGETRCAELCHRRSRQLHAPGGGTA
jgi:hypothetical protein